MELITRKQAKLTGLSKYFTGVLCKNGHIAQRYVLSGTCEDCIRADRSLVLSPKAEILPPARESLELLSRQEESRIRLGNERLALLQKKTALQAKKLELQAQNAELLKVRRMQFATASLERSQERQMRLANRQERIERRQRRETVKEKLIEVIVLIEPTDYERITLMVWAFAATRDSRLRPVDVIARPLDQARHVFYCFPSDKEAILVETNRLYHSHHSAEIERKRQEIFAQLALQAESEDNGQPEGDPT